MDKDRKRIMANCGLAINAISMFGKLRPKELPCSKNDPTVAGRYTSRAIDVFPYVKEITQLHEICDCHPPLSLLPHFGNLGCRRTTW